MDTNKVIEEFWRCFADMDWQSLKSLIAPSFTAYWPQSEAFFKNRELYVEMNQNYPGEHKFEIKNINVFGETAISEVLIHSKILPHFLKEEEVKTEEEEVSLYAVSIFKIKDSQIQSLVEYWGDCYEPPSWQQKYLK
ncbi:MAG: nuclear transport factor 2 family protein [Bdellovibrionota bacterium]|nr:hypothetical protein [Pseudobdellovibrionaceae bacterium]|tara:strand:- start:62236 stop:62646 length:411 start_codon:yes stop_codon:yes gene_type:complete